MVDRFLWSGSDLRICLPQRVCLQWPTAGALDFFGQWDGHFRLHPICGHVSLIECQAGLFSECDHSRAQRCLHLSSLLLLRKSCNTQATKNAIRLIYNSMYLLYRGMPSFWLQFIILINANSNHCKNNQSWGFGVLGFWALRTSSAGFCWTLKPDKNIRY